MGKRLIWAWMALDALHLASGLAAVLFFVIMTMQQSNHKLDGNTLRDIIISKDDLLGAIVLGVVVLVSFLMSLWGIATGLNKNRLNVTGLKAFNWSLVAAELAVMVVGVAIWIFTLRPRSEFSKVWLAQPPATQVFLQESMKCCGYFNATATGLLQQPTGFCAAVAQGTNATVVPGCISSITKKADFLLNNLFSTIFGFAAIQTSLFLATCCVINWRREEERFKRIDATLGRKGGFV